MTNDELDAIGVRYTEDGVIVEDITALVDEIHQLWAQVGSLGALLKLSEAEVERLTPREPTLLQRLKHATVEPKQEQRLGRDMADSTDAPG